MAAILKLTFLLVVLLLLSDFIFAEKFIHIVMSPSAKRTKPSAEKLSECSENEILVTEQEPEPKCYPKVHQLFQECDRNQQCMPSNSFCGFFYNELDDSERIVCLCNKGLDSSWDNTTCGMECEEAMQFDSIKNVTQPTIDCPSPNQVCKQGICFCPSEFSVNQDGLCVENALVRSNTLENVDKPAAPVNDGSTSIWIICLIVGAATILVGTAIGLAVFVVKRKNSSMQEGTSPEDRELEALKVSE